MPLSAHALRIMTIAVYNCPCLLTDEEYDYIKSCIFSVARMHVNYDLIMAESLQYLTKKRVFLKGDLEPSHDCARLLNLLAKSLVYIDALVPENVAPEFLMLRELRMTKRCSIDAVIHHHITHCPMCAECYIDHLNSMNEMIEFLNKVGFGIKVQLCQWGED